MDILYSVFKKGEKLMEGTDIREMLNAINFVRHINVRDKSCYWRLRKQQWLLETENHSYINEIKQKKNVSSMGFLCLLEHIYLITVVWVT